MPEVALVNKSGQPPSHVKQLDGRSANIDVDNDDFSAVQADPEVILVDNRFLNKLLIHIHNKHATNGLSYEISGHADEQDTPPALTVVPEAWHVVPNGTGNIAAESNDAFILTDNWTWIAIRLKRQVASNDATADVFVRAE